jgi:hypothetical protein
MLQRLEQFASKTHMYCPAISLKLGRMTNCAAQSLSYNQRCDEE